MSAPSAPFVAPAADDAAAGERRRSKGGDKHRSRAERHRDASERRSDERAAERVAARPLGSECIGYRMLVAMGWRPGRGLGPPGREGRLEPILVQPHRAYEGGCGLGADARSAEKSAADAAYDKALAEVLARSSDLAPREC